MNKFIAGIVIVALGGLAGWYYFRGAPATNGKPGGTVQENQQGIPQNGRDVNVPITEEQTGAGGTKGGLATEATVTYTDAGYSPKSLTVKAGTSVTFKNDSAGGMWTASAMHPTHKVLPGFDALKSVMRGGTYTYTFTKVGTWQFHNHVKPSDTGTVVVTE